MVKKNFSKKCILVGVIALLLLFLSFLTGLMLKKRNRVILDQYYEKYTYILDGYSKAIDYCLENYLSSLKLLLHKQKLTEKNQDQITAYIQKIFQTAHPDFYKIFFADTNNTVYYSDGDIINYSNNEALKSTFVNTQPLFFVGPLLSSKDDGIPVFVIYIPILDHNKKFQGAIGACIKAETIQKVFKNISMTDGSKVFLTDQMGQFIITNRKDLIGKTYTPKNSDYQRFSSKYVSSLGSGHLETVGSDNTYIDLFFQEIEVCKWTIMISVPFSTKKTLYSKFITINTLIIILIIFAVTSILFQIGFHFYTMYEKRLLSISVDSLTGLWTRPHFEKVAQKLIDKNPKSKFMLIECDIRGFKFINQNYGGEEADKIIVFLAKILNEHAQKLQGIIGRGFADHFYYFCKISSVHKSMAVFKEQQEKLNEKIKNYYISFFPKFGISFVMKKEDASTAKIQELIGQASFAKSTIKDNMLVQYAIYNSRLLDKVNKERYIENNMEQALENGEFFVLYQPKIELLSDKIVGAEALVRWNSPKLGIVLPDEFIPLFERNGFIKKLDFYVYRTVFAFLQRQIDEGRNIVPISVNMSRSHAKPDKFMREFLSNFHQFNIPPKLIEVEILERSFMNGNTLKEFTELLHKEGFTVAIDDFGSGESSLNMLTQIPVDVLKFDRTFLYGGSKDGKIDPTNANFIEKLIEIGKYLQKQTIFEGVETQEQIDFLRSVDCDQVQGFFFSKPLTEIDFINYLNNYHLS